MKANHNNIALSVMMPTVVSKIVEKKNESKSQLRAFIAFLMAVVSKIVEKKNESKSQLSVVICDLVDSCVKDR